MEEETWKNRFVAEIVRLTGCHRQRGEAIYYEEIIGEYDGYTPEEAAQEELNALDWNY